MTVCGTNVLIGNILINPDMETMVRVLKVLSEKFRDNLAKSISEWMTSLKKELGRVPERDIIKEYYLEGWSELGVDRL